MYVTFVRPYLLFLILALLPVFWFHRHSLVDMPVRQRGVSVGIRCLILGLLVLALSGATLGLKSDRQQVIVLIDRSASVSEEGERIAAETARALDAQKPRADRVDVIYFAGDRTPLMSVPEAAAWTNAVPEAWADRETDVAGALQESLAQLDPAYGGRIVLCSDGHATTLDPLSHLRGAARAGRRVDVVPLPSHEDAEVQVTQVKAPGRVYVGEPFPLRVTVQSKETTTARVIVYVNGVQSHQEEMTLKPGLNTASFRQIPAEERVLRYSVKVEADNDRFVDNNIGYALVRTAGKPKVLLIDPRPQDGKYLRWALQKEDIEMEVRSVRGIPRTVADLQNFDLLCFSDVAATELTVVQMDLIRTYVRDLGGGFIMLGGENSFGLGGYYKTVIEEILPVRTDFERERETPSLGMVLVVDKSGSMGGKKIELAKEAAKATAELLDSRDQLGVVAFDGQSRWVCEIHSAADREYIFERISSLQAGGGTAMGPALSAAYSGLEMTVVKLKHVILLTDGHSTPANYYDVVTAMRSSGITVSTVGVGNGADQELLERIASWGEGRYYFTEDPLTIPQIFAKETITASRSAIREQPFMALPMTAHQVVQGIDFDSAPFLLGYVSTKPKPTCELILVTESSEPLLALWRFGLGQVAAFTSDAKNRWAAEWVEWPGFSKFWAQVVREIMRSESVGGMQARVVPAGKELQIEVDAPEPQGDFALTVVGPNLGPTEHRLEQEAPGLYTVSVPADDFGDYHLQIARTVAGQVVERAEAEYSQGYPDELRIRPADEERLRTWAAAGGGGFDVSTETFFQSDRLQGDRIIRFWPLLLSLAMLVLLLDVALRRIEFGQGRGGRT